MHHVFVTPDAVSDENRTLTLTGEDYHHIVHVLRMKAGEEISVSVSGDMRELRYGIGEITKDSVICTLRSVREGTSELPGRVILFQALPKSDKMEQIIEKTVELGVARIVPVSCARCVVRLDEKKEAGRIERWRRIAKSAAMQARRGIIPEVTGVHTFAEALSAAEDADLRLMPYELAGEEGAGMSDTRRLIEAVGPGKTVAVFIGPEGGFTPSEVDSARAASFAPVTLGNRILRTETAGMTVMAWLMYQLEA